MEVTVPLYTHHCGHSSVTILSTGQCLEIRRGSQRYYAIPDPCMWNSLDEWYAAIPYLPVDLLYRPVPAHFNAEQTWMYQWHEVSTVSSYTNGTLAFAEKARVLVEDLRTGSLLPVFMDIQSGLMYIHGLAFASFAHTQYIIGRVWRWEEGVYYCIHDPQQIAAQQQATHLYNAYAHMQSHNAPY